MTEAEGIVPPEVAEALLAIQGLVNDLVAKTVGAALLSGTGTLTASTAALSGTGVVGTSSGSGAGTFGFTGTGIGHAPPLTPEHVKVLRGYARKLAAGGVVAVVVIEKIDALASFADRMLGLLQ